MKEFLVIFTKTNARILSNPSDKEIRYYKNSVRNPDLMQVRHVPPHFWKMDKYRNVMPMTPQEQKLRLAAINRWGVDNEIRRLNQWQFRPDICINYLKHLGTFVFSVASVLFAWAVLEEKYPGLIKQVKQWIGQ